MGTAKDLVDLTTEFIERIKDRKEIPEWLKLLSLVHAVSSENGILQQEKIQLTAQISEIQSRYSLLTEEYEANEKQAPPWSPFE